MNKMKKSGWHNTITRSIQFKISSSNGTDACVDRFFQFVHPRKMFAELLSEIQALRSDRLTTVAVGMDALVDGEAAITSRFQAINSRLKVVPSHNRSFVSL